MGGRSGRHTALPESGLRRSGSSGHFSDNPHIARYDVAMVRDSSHP